MFRSIKRRLFQMLSLLLILCMAACGGSGSPAATTQAAQAATAATTAAQSTTAAAGQAATAAAAAQSTTAVSTQAADAATTAAASAPAQDSAFADLPYMEITYYCDYNFLGPIASVEDNKYVDWIIEKFNTKIVVDNPGAAGYRDRLSVVMASGQPHDVVQAFSSPIATYKKFAKDGLFQDLKPYIDDTAKYPNFLGGIRPEAWVQITEEDGGIYSIPSARYDVPGGVNFVRKDWVEKLGIEPPVTLEDWRAMFERFVNEDPDGNGAKDTYGLLCDFRDGGLGWPIFRIPFDCSSYKIVDGQIIPWNIQENYKQFLIFAAGLVRDGLVDPEYPNYTDEIYIEKLREAKHGATTYVWHGNKLPEYADGTIEEHWVSFDWPQSPDGQPTGDSYSNVNRHLQAIPVQTSAEKLERILTLMNWSLSDEGKQWIHMGIPGDEFVESGDTYEVFAPKDLMSNLFLFFSFGGGTLNELDIKYLVPGFGQPAVDRLISATSAGKFDRLGAYLPYYEELSTFGLEKITQEYELKAILGNVDVEETWDQYVSDYLRAGGQQAIDFWMEWYNNGGKELVENG